MLYNMLPKFLMADNSQERPGKLYVVHMQSPRFVLEGSDEDFSQEQNMYWLDEPVTDENVIEKLKQEAENFLEKELDSQEELYDTQIGEE